MLKTPTQSIVVIQQMPLYLAMVEVVELFYWLHREHLPFLKQPTFRVTVKLMERSARMRNSLEWFLFRVRCTDLSVNFDLKQYLDVHGDAILRILKEMQKNFGGPPSELMWLERKDEGSPQATFHWATIHNGSLQFTCELKESKATGMSFAFKVFQVRDFVKSETKLLEDYMHKFKITNPNISVTFVVNTADSITKDFKFTDSKANLGSRAIATDAEHFSPIREEYVPPAKAGKVNFKLGSNRQFGSIKCVDNSTVLLRMSAIAAVIPPTENCQDGQKINSDVIKAVEVVFYGPGSLPLLLSSSSPSGKNLCPSTLMALDDYNLKFITADTTRQEGIVQADMRYKVESLNGDPIPDDSSEITNSHKLLVIIVIEPHAQEKLELFDNFSLVDTLRQNFVQVMCKHRLRAKRVVASALNRILHNYTEIDEKKEIIHNAISTISSSVFEVVKSSTDDEFRENCLSLTKSECSRSLKDNLTASLCKFAEEKLYIAISPEEAEGPLKRKEVKPKRTRVPKKSPSPRTGKRAKQQNRGNNGVAIPPVLTVVDGNRASIINAANNTRVTVTFPGSYTIFPSHYQLDSNLPGAIIVPDPTVEDLRAMPTSELFCCPPAAGAAQPVPPARALGSVKDSQKKKPETKENVDSFEILGLKNVSEIPCMPINEDEGDIRDIDEAERILDELMQSTPTTGPSPTTGESTTVNPGSGGDDWFDTLVWDL